MCFDSKFLLLTSKATLSAMLFVCDLPSFTDANIMENISACTNTAPSLSRATRVFRTFCFRERPSSAENLLNAIFIRLIYARGPMYDCFSVLLSTKDSCLPSASPLIESTKDSWREFILASSNKDCNGSSLRYVRLYSPNELSWRDRTHRINRDEVDQIFNRVCLKRTLVAEVLEVPGCRRPFTGVAHLATRS